MPTSEQELSNAMFCLMQGIKELTRTCIAGVFVTPSSVESLSHKLDQQ